MGEQLLYEISACSDVVLAAVFAKRMLIVYQKLSLIPNSLKQIRKLGRKLTVAMMFGFVGFCVTSLSWIISSWGHIPYFPTRDVEG